MGAATRWEHSTSIMVRPDTMAANRNLCLIQRTFVCQSIWLPRFKSDPGEEAAVLFVSLFSSLNCKKHTVVDYKKADVMTDSSGNIMAALRCHIQTPARGAGGGVKC